MEMTEAQAGTLAVAYERRLMEDEDNAEHWWPVEPALLPGTHELCEKGWLLRRIRDDVEWRLSDDGITALRLDTIRSAQSPN